MHLKSAELVSETTAPYLERFSPKELQSGFLLGHFVRDVRNGIGNKKFHCQNKVLQRTAYIVH